MLRQWVYSKVKYLESKVGKDLRMEENFRITEIAYFHQLGQIGNSQNGNCDLEIKWSVMYCTYEFKYTDLLNSIF